MDLRTKYLGLELKNPVMPSASPLSKDLGKIKKLEDAGASAIVMWSLFEEEIESEQLELHFRTSIHSESYAEALNYFPEFSEYKIGPDYYLEQLRKIKETVNIPVIASLNGKSMGGWIEYAKQIQEAGADALELNIYFLATDPNKSGAEIDKLYIDIVKEVRKAVQIPIAVKLSPYFSSTAWIANELSKAGANGLVLFNRFYQPDIDLENLEVVPNIILSTPFANRLPLRWIAILYGRVNVDFAASSGIASAEDVIKMIMVGASATQMFSVLIKHGENYISKILDDMKKWMEEHEYESIEQMKGSMSHKAVENPAAFERANYMKILQTFDPSKIRF
ncbi:MAG: dihydroorotate dehydrogenase-like protein [Ignavibacteria bacterium]|nr:dihydroorotate dehydrogenase-like protein [Ignavibacteria bacterium]